MCDIKYSRGFHMMFLNEAVTVTEGCRRNVNVDVALFAFLTIHEKEPLGKWGFLKTFS